MPATLSSTFDIVFDGIPNPGNPNDPLVPGGATDTVTMSVGPLGRGTFIVEEMSATGVSGGVATLTRSITGGPVAECTITAALTVPGKVETGNQVVPAGENLIVTATVQDISRFVIRCRTVGTPVPHVTV